MLIIYQLAGGFARAYLLISSAGAGLLKKMNIEHRTSNIECLMGKDEETEELIKIFVASIKTAKKKQK